MRLRLRSVESNETLRVDVPNSSTLHQLKQLLSASTAVPALSLHLSLNRRDELCSRNPDDTLQSLGLRSGDLVFHTQNPSAFAPAVGEIVNPSPNQDSGEQVSRGEAPVAMDSENGVSCFEGLDSDMIDSIPEEQRLDSDSVSQCVDFDGDAAVHGSVVISGEYSEPCFLRRVLRDEMGEDGGDHRLVVIAVHAVMLESGLVGIDPVTGTRTDRFCLPDQWPSTAFTLSLQYSLPELVSGVGNMPEGLVLKFQSLGHFITVYGSLAKGKSSLHRVCLDEHRFVQVIDSMWEKNEKNAEKKETHRSSCSYPEKEVFEFWKTVKDGLALPLLIGLTERVGLPLPSCFMCLPTELKLKIFYSLTGVDLAKVGCVSSELRYLAANSELWKKKYADEFDEPVEIQGSVNWKQTFARSWEANKKRKRESSGWQVPRVGRPHYRRIIWDPNRFGFPGVIGGDYDRLPGLSLASPLRHPLRRQLIRRNVAPHCQLGGFNV